MDPATKAIGIGPRGASLAAIPNPLLSPAEANGFAAPNPNFSVPNGITNRVPLEAGAIMFCLNALGMSLTPFHDFIFLCVSNC